MDFGRRDLFIRELESNAARTEPAHSPANEREECPEENRDATADSLWFFRESFCCESEPNRG
jgi:hypothetical protein